MNKAARLMARVEQLGVDKGSRVLEAEAKTALSTFERDDVLCIMHSDGSVNFVALGEDGVSVEAISAVNILKVLQHYRPFPGVFKDQLH
jgi:hypothetical protein